MGKIKAIIWLVAAAAAFCMVAIFALFGVFTNKQHEWLLVKRDETAYKYNQD